MSHDRPQKSLSDPKTVDAKMELVPNPDPAGMAESRVISMPVPKA